MTVTYGFYDSVNGDRKYSAREFSEVFSGIIEDGVHKGLGDDFAVTSSGGLAISVGRGRAWFNDTWTNNDLPLPLNLSAANAAQPRIDTVVLEVDLSESVRANRIYVVQGTAAATPVAPVMTHTATVHQYPLANIYRAANSSSVNQGNITNRVGTPATPYAASRLISAEHDTSIMRRSTYRGKNLGSTYTVAQQAAVKSGQFEDLYPGDYWEMSGWRFRIVDINYYLGKGSTVPNTIANGSFRVTDPHLVIMPDQVMRYGPMNKDFYKANAGAYGGADARVEHLNPLVSTLDAYFARDLRMTFMTLITTAMANNLPSANAWRPAGLELPTMQMITGSDFYIPSNGGLNLPPAVSTEAYAQFSAFRMNPLLALATHPPGSPTTDGDPHVWYWTRDVISPVSWVTMSRWGDISTQQANNSSIGFRPYFCLKGN